MKYALSQNGIKCLDKSFPVLLTRVIFSSRNSQPIKFSVFPKDHDTKIFTQKIPKNLWSGTYVAVPD